MTGTESQGSWFGLCRKPPGLHAAPAILVSGPWDVHPGAAGGGGPAGTPGRIRDGIGIAAGAFRALVRDRLLLRFMSLAGLVMLFLVLTEAWMHRYIDPAFPAVLNVGGAKVSVSLQNLWVVFPVGQSHGIFYFGLFLIEAVCLFGFCTILAGIIRYRIGTRKSPATVRHALAGIRSSLGTLAILSLALAFVATIAYDLVFNNLAFSGILNSILQLFWLPYAYYEPRNWMLSLVYYSASFFSLELMAINAVLFLAALFLVPGIVLEKKGLRAAIAGSVALPNRSRREILGCVLVGAGIILGFFALGVLIGQLPSLLNHDYDFFLSASRGYWPMMILCYGFVAGSWALMAAGFTAAGVAVAGLYSRAMTGQVPEPGEAALSG